MIVTPSVLAPKSSSVAHDGTMASAWNDLKQAPGVPVLVQGDKIARSAEGPVHKNARSPTKSRRPTESDVKLEQSKRLRAIGVIPSKYFDLVMAAVLQDCQERDAQAEQSTSLPPLDLGSSRIRPLIRYKNETGLTTAVKVLLEPRLTCFLTAFVGEEVVLQFPSDDYGIPDLILSAEEDSTIRSILELKLLTVLSEQDLVLLVSEASKGFEFGWPEFQSHSSAEGQQKAPVKSPWGAHRRGVFFRGEAHMGWSETLDEVLLQVYVELLNAKTSAVSLEAVQLDRMVAFLSNGTHYVVIAEKDCALFFSSFVLDAEHHAVNALLAGLYLATLSIGDNSKIVLEGGEVQEETAESEQAGPAGHEGERAHKRRKVDSRTGAGILQLLSDSDVPNQAVVLQAPILHFSFDLLFLASHGAWVRTDAFQSADRLANREAPEITFRGISVSRSSKHILRSARGMYIFNRDHLDELQAEAEAYRHLDAVAPIRAGSLFPRFLGRFSHQAEPAAEGLLTSALGEPIEVFDLSFLNSLDPLAALGELHDLGVAHGDLHRSNLRVVRNPPSTGTAHSAPLPTNPSLPHAHFAFIDFGRSKLEEVLEATEWQQAKLDDVKALRHTLLPGVFGGP
ncbi:hypothetical protein Rhopal_001025-T1 [Rhodotorula paludigena]|uniref:Protein kinase domain-containing protein n=1 Tax=Rhodotorula paludigena TaxID=86838 RepID=A0AAV5GFE4_9BASI|nr:hypothetical protein Rhopal_001025-T1 [Rhodotorula paludigena]